MTRHPLLFTIAIVFAAVCVLLAVYYSIPGIYHPFFAISDGQFQFVDANTHPFMVKSAHHKYTLLLIGAAVVFALIAFLFRGRKTVRVI